MALLRALIVFGMVVVMPPRHTTERFSVAMLGSGLANLGDPPAHGSFGGGAAFAWQMMRGFRVWLALETRARVFAVHEPRGFESQLAIDVVVRGGPALYRPPRREPLRPIGDTLSVDLHDVEPIEPYAGLGATVVLPITAHDDTRAGPVALLGVAFWIAQRASIFAEVEGRLVFGRSTIFSIGGNVGVELQL